jgi:uncharacterized protein
MDLTNFADPVVIGSGFLIAFGLIGVVLPVVPGLALTWLGVLVWAFLGHAGASRWVVLGLASAIAGLGLVAKYLVPGRRLKHAGVHTGSLFAGGVLAVIGFFVIPIVGLVLGFVLGIWLAEQLRLHDAGAAWRATKHALGAVGLAMMIELTAGLIVAVIWAVGVALS